MSVTCLIVEDQMYAAGILRDYINIDPRLTLIAIEQDAQKALSGIMDGSLRADITFLDIHMRSVSGIQIAEAAKDLTTIIFTTAYPEHGVKAYRLGVIDYLLKPIEHKEFKEAVDKALQWIDAKRPKICIPGKGKGNYNFIPAHDILFIQGAQHYVYIYTVNQRFMMHIPIKDVLERFGKSQFFRVHKSFVVNIAHVRSISNDSIHLSYGRMVSLSPSYRQAFLDRLKQQNM